MAAEQTEPRDCNSYSVDFPIAEATNDGRLSVSTEMGALDSTACTGVAATGGIMQNDTVTFSEMVSLESGNKKNPRDTGGVVISDSMSAVGDDDSRAVGSVSINTPAALDKCKFSEGNPIALDMSKADDVQLVASKQGSSTVTLNRTEVFDCAITAENPRVSHTEQHISNLLPRGPKVQDKVTIGACEDSKRVVGAVESGVHGNLKLTFTSALVSNQLKGFEVASTNKSEHSKAVDATLNCLEGNQVAEDAYDMEFDIFPEEHCMFTPLDTNKTESWPAIVVNDVIMEKSTGVLHSNHHSQVRESVPSPEEANNESLAVHELKEKNAVSNVDRVYDTERESLIRSVQMDSPSMEERSAFSNTHVKANEEGASLDHEADVATVPSDSIKDNDLACKYSQIESVSDIQGQCQTDDRLKSLEGINMDCTKAARSYETKRLEDEDNSIKTDKMESESASVSTTHRDAAMDLQELDHGTSRGQSVYDIATADLNTVPEDVEHNEEAAGLLEDVRLVRSIAVDGIPTQAGGNVLGQDSECLDLAKKDEIFSVKCSGSSSMDQCMDQTYASTSLIHCSADPCIERSLDAEHRMQAGDLSGAVRPGSCAGEEGSQTQVDIQGKDTCPIPGNWHFAETDDSVDQFGEPKAGDHLVNNSKAASLSHCLGAHYADSLALTMKDVIEPEQLLKVIEEKEIIPLADCRAVLSPATKYETSLPDQNAMHEELAVHSMDIQDNCGVLCEPLCMKPSLENQSTKLVVMDGVLNSTVVRDNFGLVEGMEAIKIIQNEAKALSIETPQGELTYADDVYDGAREPIHSKLKEIHIQVDEAVEDTALKVTAESNKQACGIASNEEIDGGSLCVFNKDGDEILDMRDAILDNKAIIKEQEIEAVTKALETEVLNEVSEDHVSMQPFCTVLPELNTVANARNQESPGDLSSHLPSLPEFETVMSYRTELVEKVGMCNGLEDTKNFVASEKTAAPVGRTRARRQAYAFVPVKKQSKRLKTSDNPQKPEVLNKVGLSTVKEGYEGICEEDRAIAESYSEQINDASLENMPKPIDEGLDFSIGEMVWAKVKSHPWWPGLVFDPADASKSARKAEKAGRVLVAFFGDCTFAWVQESQMIPFRPYFEEKAPQTTIRVFCRGVEESLEELCRRAELGLSCEHFKGSLRKTGFFPDLNTGIRGGVNVERLRGICTSAENFGPKETLDFVKSIAASPLGEWCSTPQWAELRGYAYGLRTCMVAVQGSGSVSMVSMPPAAISQSSKLKRSHSSLEQAIPDAAVSGKESKTWKKSKSDKERKNSERKGVNTQMKSALRDLPEVKEGNKPKNIVKKKLSKMPKFGQLASCMRQTDTRSTEEAAEERNLDDAKKTMLGIAGHSTKVFKKSSSKANKFSTSIKRVLKQIGEQSQKITITRQTVKAKTKAGSSDMGNEALVTIQADMDDPFSVPRSPSLSDGIKKVELPNATADIGLRREAPIMDNAGKNEPIRRFSKVGDSIRRVASELKGTPVTKCDGDSRPEGLEVKKHSKDPSLAFQTSTGHKKGFSNESPEDVSLLQLRRDLELLAKDAGMRKRSSCKKYGR